MDELERKLFRGARRRTAQRRLGNAQPMCVSCGEDDPRVLEREHIAGHKHDDTTFFMCRNCHGRRSGYQDEQPPGGPNPRNPLEVIGRWLLGIAEYFELMMVTLRRFGEFLIGLARQGYGSDLALP